MGIDLHIVANSDSARDQAMKMRVKEAVMGAIAGRGRGIESFHELWPDIQRAARRAGFGGEMRLETEPTAVRIILGEGRGHNWWGLLMPDFTEALAGAGEVQWLIPQILRGWF